MKGYEYLSSRLPHIGASPVSKSDIDRMAIETASDKEAISKSILAITMLITRVMTVDSCIDIMRRRDPFAKLDRAMDDMQRLCSELTAQCMMVYEFCIADNVLDLQDIDEHFSGDVDVAADMEESYGRDSGNRHN